MDGNLFYFMPEYLAKYIIFADLYRHGFFVPNSRPYRQHYRFNAPDCEEAFVMARSYMQNFLATFFNAKSQLEELIEVDGSAINKRK